MERTNFYFIQLNPCLIDRSKEKSKLIKELFKSYKKSINPDASLGEVRLFSFSPTDNSSYSEILELYLPLMKSPCVLVTYSPFDLAPIFNVAYGRLSFALNIKKIKAIYFTNYSMEKDARSYRDKLANIFRNSNNYGEKNISNYVPRSVQQSDELIEAIKDLRRLSPPVLFSDLAAVTGISESSVRRKGQDRSTSSEHGVHISTEQKAELIAVMENAIIETLNNYDTLEETFIP